jgi:hypothetical protein
VVSLLLILFDWPGIGVFSSSSSSAKRFDQTVIAQRKPQELNSMSRYIVIDDNAQWKCPGEHLTLESVIGIFHHSRSVVVRLAKWLQGLPV